MPAIAHVTGFLTSLPASQAWYVPATIAAKERRWMARQSRAPTRDRSSDETSTATMR